MVKMVQSKMVVRLSNLNMDNRLARKTLREFEG